MYPKRERKPVRIQIVWNPSRQQKDVYVVNDDGTAVHQKAFNAPENKAMKDFTEKLAAEMNLPIRG